MKEALFYEKLENKKVICRLCPHNCIIDDGDTGICKSRKNLNGILYTINYGKTVTINPYDPVEKKPLFHFIPGERILSIGANYCNLRCNYCQNWEISQEESLTEEITKEEIHKLLNSYKLNALAYTYTEPVIWYEFVYDSAKYMMENNCMTVMVTNGYINEEPLQLLLPYLAAMNIDLKSMNDDFYKKNCGGKLEPVLNTIKLASKNTHLEITNLIITEENDGNEEINELINFIAEIDPRIPLHFSRYYPAYKLKKPSTNPERLIYAYNQAKKKLHHVYLGNMIFENKLECEKCHKILGYRDYGIPLEIEKGICPWCGHKQYGIW